VTETARRLARLGEPALRARVVAVVLGGGGAALASAAVGLHLAPRPAAVAGAWAAVLTAVAAAAVLAVRVRRREQLTRMGALVESVGGARRGSVRGLLTPAAAMGTSGALFAAADARGVATVTAAWNAARRRLARESRRYLSIGGATLAIGAGAALTAAPASGRSAAFWHPVATWRAARAPITVTPDRRAVRRGDEVTLSVRAAGAVQATLWTRAPGESWQALTLSLDADGAASRRVGPLESDLLVRVTAGARASDTARVRVLEPLFAGELEFLARYPAYLARPDEPLVPGPDTVVLPAGTRVMVRGRTSAPLRAARWIGPGTGGALQVGGDRFEGAFLPRRSGRWTVALEPVEAGQAVTPLPPLTLAIVLDSAPVVTIAIPGRDTTAPLSLRQPLVIDVRDDHAVARVDIVSWRVSQTGRVDPPVRERALASELSDRVIVQGELVLDERGLLPGDTLRYYVEAWDNAPRPGRGASPEYVLRLPSRAEMRAAARAAAAAAAAAADSMATAQAGLAERTRDIAAERSRGEADRGAAVPTEGTLGFEATERASEIAREQAELQARAGELAASLDELARAVDAAGLQDSAFLARLEQVGDLLQRALTPELERRLRDLQDALQRLDADATRRALQQLAEAQQQLRADLERNRELFERAALEGTLSTLAADADELADRQTEWVRADAPRADSATAAAERALAARGDSLAGAVAEAAAQLPRSERATGSAPLDASQASARRATETMRAAAAAAGAGDSRGAAQLGVASAATLDSLATTLRDERDALAQAWREEALAALDRALAETATLAEQQADVADALHRGESGSALRRQQGALEDGVGAVERQVREAGGRNALVSPQLESALGYAQRQMREAREQLNQAQPNPAAAAALADEALDALNATAHAIARARGAVADAQSGSGFAEAVEELARLAAQQQGLAGEGQGMLPMMGRGGQAVLQQLRALAVRQRALAEQLEQLHATGASEASGALAAEARELARQLEAGRLDRRTVERQQRLYRRLLDAGRTLTGDEPDPDRERVSRTAQEATLRRPPPLAADAAGRGPRVRYPTWEELRGLTPDERRLVLEYYRRLNAPTP